MSVRRHSSAAVALVVPVLAALVLGCKGVIAMAESSVKLGWEWRAGRALAQRAGLRIVAIHDQGGGLFGIGRSPSLGGAVPDARQVEARVVAVDGSGPTSIGASVAFRVPKVELRGAGEGTLVAIGIIGDKVVCLAPAPGDVTEATLADWLLKAPCP